LDEKKVSDQNGPKKTMLEKLVNRERS